MQVALVVFLGVACLLVAGFLVYHTCLIASGTTTYEVYKWREVHRRRQAEKLAEQSGDKGSEQSWVRKRRLGDVDRLDNIYDRGLVANFTDAVVLPTWARKPSLHSSKGQ